MSKESFLRALARYTVFAFAGVAAIAAAAATNSTAHPVLNAVLLNLGLVSVAVVLIDILWRLAGGNPVEEQIVSLGSEVNRLARTVDAIQNTRSVGLESVFDCTGNFGGQADWLALIERAGQHVDLMGRALEGWVRPNEIISLIERKIVKEGVTFRWLVMSEDNRYLSLLEEGGSLLTERVSHKLPSVYERLWAVRDKLPKDKHSSLQVRVFSNEPLYCSVVRIDDRFLVTPYLAVVGARDCPLICFSGGQSPWARSIGAEFEHVWTGAQDLFSLPRKARNNPPNQPAVDRPPASASPGT
jgi:hypothetical protein